MEEHRLPKFHYYIDESDPTQLSSGARTAPSLLPSAQEVPPKRASSKLPRRTIDSVSGLMQPSRARRRRIPRRGR
jgi:hypothetical protein